MLMRENCRVMPPNQLWYQFRSQMTSRAMISSGDQLKSFYPKWYDYLNSKQQVIQLDLKQSDQRMEFDKYLDDADLLITSHMNSSLKKLNFTWDYLSEKHKNLSLLHIYSYRDENRPGHDLNFQFHHKGLVEPPTMPHSLYGDILGAERIASLAAMMLLTSHTPTCEKIYLCDPVRELAAPIQYGATGNIHGPLSGGLPTYNLYECKDGWIALCALEIHFQERLCSDLKTSNVTKDLLVKFFKGKSVTESLRWGKYLGVPISSSLDHDPL